MHRIRLVLLLTVLGLVLFMAPVKDGRPVLDLADLKARAARLRQAVPGGAGEEGAHASESVRTLYKWRDEKGTWNYSNVRPPDHPEAQEIRVPVSWVEGDGGAAAGSAEEGSSEEPRSAGELLEESRRLEKTVGGRESELDRVMRETNP